MRNGMNFYQNTHVSLPNTQPCKASIYKALKVFRRI
nr:MAG TPA: hypothetical protein [Caudoviricetes sp.]DAP89947.1 MAG TPA: hypothetical protein [Caudoviricetes sp.]